jgi:hypothetical protein
VCDWCLSTGALAAWPFPLESAWWRAHRYAPVWRGFYSLLAEQGIELLGKGDHLCGVGILRGSSFKHIIKMQGCKFRMKRGWYDPRIRLRLRWKWTASLWDSFLSFCVLPWCYLVCRTGVLPAYQGPLCLSFQKLLAHGSSSFRALERTFFLFFCFCPHGKNGLSVWKDCICHHFVILTGPECPAGHAG